MQSAPIYAVENEKCAVEKGKLCSGKVSRVRLFLLTCDFGTKKKVIRIRGEGNLDFRRTKCKKKIHQEKNEQWKKFLILRPEKQ